MTAHAPRLPFSLDPLIAKAKRRARQRRLLLLLLVAVAGALALVLGSSGGGSGSAGLSGRLGNQTTAGQPRGRPASKGEYREMTNFVDYPRVRGGLLGAAWVSGAHHDLGLVLLYPGHWLGTAQTGSYPMHWGEVTTVSPRLVPGAAKPVWAYLIRLPSRHANGELLAQTVLRGANVLEPELANFCALGKRLAPSLTTLTCREAG